MAMGLRLFSVTKREPSRPALLADLIVNAWHQSLALYCHLQACVCQCCVKFVGVSKVGIVASFRNRVLRELEVKFARKLIRGQTMDLAAAFRI